LRVAPWQSDAVGQSTYVVSSEYDVWLANAIGQEAKRVLGMHAKV